MSDTNDTPAGLTDPDEKEVGPDDNIGHGVGNYQDVTAEEQADTSDTPARRAAEGTADDDDDDA
jgi:hypothetical protein